MRADSTHAANSPRLALVLGSGGVRSIAALGIAEVLSGEGMRPDLIVGCSSGALFGTCIAMGMSGEEGLEAATRLWSAELTQKKRWRAYFELIAPKWSGFGAGFSLRDAGPIRERVEMAFENAQLEQLSIPLRVATTDAATGEARVITHGPVADAVRASMALPFIFPSVEIEGRRLTDGVISDPLPVSAACDAYASIAVGFRGAMPRRIDRASRLVAQVSTAMINNLQQARVAAAFAAGQRILQLELDIDRRIGLWDTAAMPRIFDLGRRHAEKYLPAIRRLLEDAPMNKTKLLLTSAAVAAALIAPGILAAKDDPAKTVAALDTEYQAAVERNDWQTMDRILHRDFTLVLGNGTIYTRAQLIESARDKHIDFEKQVEMPGTQTVRLFGDSTATVTALLWLKGKRNADQSTFEYQLWFSDTYVRTPDGWAYAFGQASLRLPK